MLWIIQYFYSCRQLYLMRARKLCVVGFTIKKSTPWQNYLVGLTIFCGIRDQNFQRFCTVAQKCHGNFNLLTAISICSRQFQFAHGSFNWLTAVSICSWQFQFAHGSFNFAHDEVTVDFS